jgi:hypothetical protein
LIFFNFHGGGATITKLAGGVHNYFQLFSAKDFCKKFLNHGGGFGRMALPIGLAGLEARKNETVKITNIEFSPRSPAQTVSSPGSRRAVSPLPTLAGVSSIWSLV